MRVCSNANTSKILYIYTGFLIGGLSAIYAREIVGAIYSIAVWQNVSLS